MRVPWGPRAAGWAAVVAVMLGLCAVVSGRTWVVQALLASGVVVGVGALLSRTRVPPTGAVALQLLALLVLVSFLFAPAQAVLGLVPGPQAWQHLADLVDQGRTVIASQGAPVVAAPGFLLLTTAGAGLLALLVDVLAVLARRPALAGLPLLAVHCTALVFAPGGLSWWWFALAGLGFAVLLAADAATRSAGWGRLVQRRPAPGGAPTGAGLGGVGLGGAGRSAAVLAVVAALLVPALLPGTSGGFLLTGGGGGGTGGAIDSVDPLIDLRSDLHTDGDAEVLSYTTRVKAPPPLRIVTDDSFDGDNWRPTAPDRAALRDLSGPLPTPPGLDAATPRQRSRYTITVGALRQQWLPVPYPAVGVAVSGGWQYDPATLNILGARGTRTQPDQRYTVDYLQVSPTSEQLATAAPAPPDVQAAYGRPPAGLPAVIRQTAEEQTRGAVTPYAQAVALQNFFRSGGGFVYSTDAPQPRSASALADFLQDRTGYCTHFASTMAVMARTLGIPARVAVGFLPGQQDSDGRWRIGLQDAHAWPELYFSGAGWVRFEPTPASRTGVVPGWTVPAVAPATPANPSAAAPTVPSPAQSSASVRQAERTSNAAAAGQPAGARLPWQLPVGLAVVVGLAAAPLTSRTLVRRRRWRRARGSGERAEAAWADLVEQLGDLGFAVPASATPRQVGQRLNAGAGAGAGAGGHDAAVHRLVDAVERSRYAGPGGATAATDDQLPGDVRTVVRSLAAGRPRSATWRWRLLPPSGLAHLHATQRRLLRSRH